MPAEAEKEGTEREEKTQGSGWREGRQEKSFGKVGRVHGGYSERLDGMRMEPLALV